LLSQGGYVFTVLQIFVCLFIPQLHSDLLTNAVCSGVTQLPILPIQDIRQSWKCVKQQFTVCRG